VTPGVVNHRFADRSRKRGQQGVFLRSGQNHGATSRRQLGAQNVPRYAHTLAVILDNQIVEVRDKAHDGKHCPGSIPLGTSAIMIAILESYRAGLLARTNWWPNVMAGIMVGIVALPLAMAFAIASGARPEQGLYTAIVAGLCTSLFWRHTGTDLRTDRCFHRGACGHHSSTRRSRPAASNADGGTHLSGSGRGTSGVGDQIHPGSRDRWIYFGDRRHHLCGSVEGFLRVASGQCRSAVFMPS
jgi:hypothetical protein